MSSASRREHETTTPKIADAPPADAVVSSGGQQIPARVVAIGRSSIELILPRGARVVAGEQVSLKLHAHDEPIDELVADALCDTRRFRRASDTLRMSEAIRAQGGAAVWLRCVADSPRARAMLWALSPSGAVAASTESAHAERPARDRLPARGHDGESARLERLTYLRDRTGRPLESLEHTRLVAEHLRNNVENLIGGVEVPVGAAGPLEFIGSAAHGSIYLPMATTEGALVSSVTRGAFALTLAGGVRTRVLSQTMQRVPVFTFGNLDQACLFARWVSDHEAELREQAAQVSRHGRLTSVDPIVVGRAVHVRFSYETGDAAGQNMSTACTWHACQWILEHVRFLPGVKLDVFGVEGGMSTDKKASYGSFVRGRGVRVVAECYLDASTLRRVLKVTPEQLLNAHHIGVTGAIHAGEIGYNVNAANVIAAVFTACGQDIACVHESSLGVLSMEPAEGGVYASMLLPSLIVGTVGGGTQLPQQRDYLELMGCAGTGGVRRLAEIIAGYCLALDLSTMSAVATDTFATAHERLGRNRPVAWLRETDLDAGFFERSLDRSELGEVKVESVEKTQAQIGASVTTDLTASRNTGKLVGFFPRRLGLVDARGERRSLDVLVKVKPLDAEALTVLRTVAAVCGDDVARAARKHEKLLGFEGCHRRELAVYRQTDPRFRRHVPKVYGTFEDPAREAYVLVLERLEGLELMNSIEDTSGFRREHLHAIVDGLAELHSIWLGKETELSRSDWLGPVASAKQMASASDLWLSLANNARQEFPEWVHDRDFRRWQETIDTVESWWRELELMPRTLIHNDFHPRNVALRRVAENGYRLCAYDWELATLHVPQHDLAELLTFTLFGGFGVADVRELVELHRTKLEQKSGIALDRAQWERGFVLSLRDLLVNRVAIYTMGHTCRDYRFLPRSFRTLMRLLDQLDTEITASYVTPSSDAFRIHA